MFKGLFSIIFILAFMSFLPACTSSSTTPPVVSVVGCSVETVVTGALAAAIASNLTCSNSSAIQASIQGALGKINLCAAATTQANIKAIKASGKMQGIIGDIVCPLAVEAVMGTLSTAVPSAWGCSSLTTTSLNGVLAQACSAVVPI